MRTSLALCLGLAALPCPASAQNSAAFARAQIGSFAIEGDKTVDRVEIQRFRLAPAARGGRMKHAAPIVGYVAEGTIVLQIEGGPLQTLTAGDTVYAPANTTFERLENASTTEPAMFVATFLLGKEEKAALEKAP